MPLLFAAPPTQPRSISASKWSRALRYELRYKSFPEPLDAFIKRKGGHQQLRIAVYPLLERAASEVWMSPKAAL